MPTTTTNYAYNKPLVNDATDEDLWGGYLNTTIDDIDGDMKTATDFVTSSVSSTHAGSVSDRNKLLLCSASGGAFDVDLVAAATAGSGFTMMVKKTDSSANAVTIDPNGAETIDGASSFALSTQYDFVLIVSDGSNWHILAKATSAAATDTSSGIVELATAAETLTGSDTARVITPAGFAGNKSLAASGYYKLPGGLILQWGTQTPAAFTENTTNTVTFPTAFSSACYSVTIQHQQASFMGSNSNTTVFLKNAPGTTSFTYAFDPVSGTPTGTIYWMAVGV